MLVDSPTPSDAEAVTRKTVDALARLGIQVLPRVGQSLTPEEVARLLVYVGVRGGFALALGLPGTPSAQC